MKEFTRYSQNPILIPSSDQPWEKYAVFNPSVIREKDAFHMFYRAVSDIYTHEGIDMRLSTIGHAQGSDGIHFSDRRLFIKPEESWEKFGCEDPRVTKIDDDYFIFYTALSSYPPHPEGIKVGLALSDDLHTIREKHLITPFNAKAMTIFPKKINNKITALLTVNTDIPPARIAIATFDTEDILWSHSFWNRWYGKLDEYTLPFKRINTDHVEIGASPIETPYGWLILYSYIRNYFSSHRVFGVEAVLLDLHDPFKIVGRIDEPLLTPVEHYETYGTIGNIVFPTSALIHDGMLRLYYGATDTTCCMAEMPLDEFLSQIRVNAVMFPRLKRSRNNPILEPKKEHYWESKAVFNPTVFEEQGTVHILYRAMSEDNTSSLGYAISHDGIHIDERLIEPVYFPRKDFEDKKKPSVNSGCEDPRITKIDDTLYMCYTAYDGINPPRVALTSIPIEDFLKRRWGWTPPALISPPDVDDKDACILPEKAHDKYVIFHRIGHDIVIDYVDSLQFDGKQWLHGEHHISPREHSWDSEKIGICAPPIKVKDGWLTLYHGISKIDREYRIGAMLLDHDDLSIVIARTDYPILDPEAQYEREGIVNNTVFPCGMVVKNQEVYIYYGAGDRVTAVSTINLHLLMSYLRESRTKKFLITT